MSRNPQAGARAPGGLTQRQEAFCLAFIETGNASEAYRRSYKPKRMSAKSIHEKASHILAEDKVQARVAELREAAAKSAELTAARTLKEIARLAYFDPRKLYDDKGNLKPVHELDDDTAAAVGAVEQYEEYQGSGEDRELIGHTKKVKPFDKNAALEKAMKHLGLYSADNQQKPPTVLLPGVRSVKFEPFKGRKAERKS